MPTAPASLAALQGARVLVVEDNPVNMMVTVALLEHWGVQVTQATQGHQALQAVAQAVADGRPFQAVLMDLQMPGLGGVQATRLLRAEHDAQALPIIALTAAALDAQRDQAAAAGMNGFLSKPLEPEKLADLLARILSGPRQASSGAPDVI